MGRDTLDPARQHLVKMYWELRRTWLKSENTEFDDKLADFFDEFEDYVGIPMGN